MNSPLRDQAPKETRRASDAIAEALIGDIRAVRIEIGQPLPTERDLCERFRASRPTVREALAQLQLRGYATAEAGHRPRAARPSLEAILRAAGDNLRDILGDEESAVHLEQMRQFIETGAAREAAAKADNLKVTKLRAALERNFEAIGTDRFAQTDIAFHRVLVSVVGNPVILALHDMFVSGLLAGRPRSENTAENHRVSYEEHRAIYEAVLDGDVIRATEVMDRHLERSYRTRLASPRSAHDGASPPST